jgi:UDP-N-acetylglucosamine 2-epimerase (non-hydrolysing)
MDKVFFDQLQLPEAKYNLDVGSGTHGKQTGEMLGGIEQVLMQETPEVVLVQGDTNTVLAGAIAATKLGIRVGHIEAGLRSYDRNMPEETNRVLADHCSDYLFAPTETSKQILLHEGITADKVFMVGNTVVDAAYQNLEIAQAKSNLLGELGLEAGKFMLATSHRQENVDNEDKFAGLIWGYKKSKRIRATTNLCYTSQSEKQLQTFGLDTDGIRLMEPLDYLAFLQLESKASLVLTDSGGVQEETCILHTPCVTLRENTERPETLEVGANVLVGTDSERILAAAKDMCCKKREWINPFGDGKTAQQIVEILLENAK